MSVFGGPDLSRLPIVLPGFWPARWRMPWRQPCLSAPRWRGWAIKWQA